MNIFLWILQILLSLHTIMGAVWKFTNSTEVVPNLAAIPHGAWLALSVFELLCSLGLILPIFNKSLAKAAPLSAIGIGAVLLLYSAVHIASGTPDHSPLIYWGIVAVICAFIAFARIKLRPIKA